MKILLFGKTRNVYRLPEDTAADLRLAGHDVRVFPYRDTKLKKILEPWLVSPRFGAPLPALLARAVRRFAPDLVLGVGPFHWLPPAFFEPLTHLPNRPPLIAWVGDSFGAEMAETANLFDIVAYTDTGMVDLHKQFGFRSTGAFIPLGAARNPPGQTGGGADRIARLAFCGSSTPHRRGLLARIAEPVGLFGPDWGDGTGIERHVRDRRRINGPQLAGIYRSHAGVLNIRHERNVINGLNQRHFAPYIEGAPVVSDPQADIEHCFDPGTEMLVYQDAASLDDVLARLRREPAYAREIGLAGQRRVLANHTYSHRVEAMAALAGLR